MTINIRHQVRIFEKIDAIIQNPPTSDPGQLVKIIILEILNQFMISPILSQLTPDLWMKIERKAPLEILDNNIQIDTALITSLTQAGIHFGYDIETIVTVFQSLFACLMPLAANQEDAIIDIILDGVIQNVLDQ